MTHDLVNLAQLGKLTVLKEDNTKVILNSLWQGQKTILMFIRHFG